MRIRFIYLKLIIIPLLLIKPISVNSLNHTHVFSLMPDETSMWERARLGGIEFWHEMTDKELNKAISELIEQKVNILYLDVGITGNYELFINPDEVISFIKRATQLAHAAGIEVFVYLSGFELITYNIENKKESVFKSHPDWIQQDINGNHAVFDSAYAAEHDIHWLLDGNLEDAWITPFNPEWRTQYMKIVQRLAATDINTRYVDVAYWMTHFPGWHNSWASFDPFTIEAFKKETGLIPPPHKDLGNWKNPIFKSWTQFRRKAIVDFLADVKAHATSITPQISIIAECFSTFTRQALTTGADPMYLWDTVDLVTHEFGLRQGEGGADAYTQSDWQLQMATMAILRGIDGTHPSWILSYASTPTASVVLAASEIMLGGNFWETKDPSMIGTVGESYRTALFNWTQAYESFLYGDWDVFQPIGVYFSPNTRDFVFYSDKFNEQDDELQYLGGSHILEVLGTILMAYRSHIPVKVVTQRDLPTLDQTCELLYLPNVAAMSDEEIDQIKRYNKSHPLIITGLPAQYYEDGQERLNPALTDWIKPGMTATGDYEVEGNVVVSAKNPGYNFFIQMYENETIYVSKTLDEQLFIKFLTTIKYQNPIYTDAPSSVIIQPYSRDKNLIIRMVNLSELGTGQLTPEPAKFTLTVSNHGVPMAPIEQITIQLAAILVVEHQSIHVIDFLTVTRNLVPYIIIVGIVLVVIIALNRKIRGLMRILDQL